MSGLAARREEKAESGKLKKNQCPFVQGRLSKATRAR